MIGIARPICAEPELPRKLLAGSHESYCESSNRCVVRQMMGLPGARMNPRVHQRLAEARQARPAARMATRGAEQSVVKPVESGPAATMATRQ